MNALRKNVAAIGTVCALAASGVGVNVVLAGPASAHTNSCTHSEHYMGHNNKYEVRFERHYNVGRVHKHIVSIRTDRNWWGNYKKVVGKRVLICKK